MQPFVTKCYECNGLIAVAEYVTVISKEEFNSSKEYVRQILSHLADRYLLGDVGSVNKNFMNWGYRADGSLVILDYAYIYRVIGDELLCEGLNTDETVCGGMLEYDINFHKLICPKCRRNYTFHEIRRKISKEYEEKEKDAIKNIAYKLTKPSQEINKNFTEAAITKTNNEGDNTMSKHHCFNDTFESDENREPVQYNEDTYEDAINFMKNIKANTNENDTEHEDDIISDMNLVDDAIDVLTDEEEPIEALNDDEDNDDYTIDDVLSIIDHESAIEEENEELDQEESETNVNNDEDVQADVTLVDNIDTGDIVPADKADDPYENSVDGTVDNIVTSETEIPVSATELNINITVSEDFTTKVEVSTETETSVASDGVDEMRALLAADIDDDDDDYSKYDDEYERGGYKKNIRKKRDFE